jgi:hypothetical protein
MIFLGDAVFNRDLIGGYNPPHPEKNNFRKEPKQTGLDTGDLFSIKKCSIL